MSSVLLKAGCFFLIILMGYGLKKIGLLSQSDLPVFSKLVTKITLPAAIIHNFSQATMDVSMLVIVLIGFLCSGAYAVIGYGLFAKGTRDQKAFGLVNASGYNIGCFTMPFVQGFLGPAGVITTSLFDTGNAVVCTGGSYAVAASVAGKGGAGDKHQIRRIVIQLLKSIPFDCYVIMTALTMAGLRIPVFMDQVADHDRSRTGVTYDERADGQCCEDPGNEICSFRSPGSFVLSVSAVFPGDPQNPGNPDVRPGIGPWRSVHLHA